MTRLIKWTEAAWLGIAVVLLLGTVTTVLCQIAFRYVLNLPLAWTEEAARIFLICAVYVALPVAYLRGEHIIINLFVKVVPGAWLFAYVLMLKLITAFVMGYFAVGAFLQAWATRNMTFISLPDLPVATIYVVQGTSLGWFTLLTLLTWRSIEVYLAPDAEEVDA